MDRYYNIHNIVRFKIADSSNTVSRLMIKTPIAQYADFSTEPIGEDDIDLLFCIGNFRPHIQECYVEGDGEYYFGEDYLYVPRETHKMASWRFEVERIDKRKTMVRISCNTLGRIFIVGNVIDFLLHLKLMEKGYPLIHASAVKKDEETVVFSARGGGGKSTLAIEMAERGYEYLGDNYTIVHGGNILSFATPISLFTYNLSRIVKKSLNLQEKTMLHAKRLLFLATGGYAKFFTKMNPDRFLDVGSSVPQKLSALFVLTPCVTSLKRQVHIQKIGKEEVIRKLVNNQRLEFPLFNRYIDEYAYFFPNKPFALHWKLYEDELRENLDEETCYYEIKVPLRLDDAAIEYVIEEIAQKTGIDL